MDQKFTEKVQAWLDLPKESRDYEQGALFLLQLNNNRIQYNNLVRNARKNGEFIERQIRKYMQFRLAQLTHEQVSEMQLQVDKIAVVRRLDKPAPTTKEKKPANAEWKEGKRQDHDSLPAEIQALYVENASIMQKMRELHLRLRLLTTENTTCPDSERYPFLKELIKLDKQYHKNWQLYDSFSTEQSAEGAEQHLIEDSRLEQKSIYRRINLTKGRYKKNPSEALKQQIADLYAQLASPVETLTEELTTLGIIGQ